MAMLIWVMPSGTGPNPLACFLYRKRAILGGSVPSVRETTGRLYATDTRWDQVQCLQGNNHGTWGLPFRLL
jgi:hypothetical protein